jgi:hypothetical protein
MSNNLKQQFLENENRRLIQEKQNLQNSLKINKQILSTVLSSQTLPEDNFIMESL